MITIKLDGVRIKVVTTASNILITLLLLMCTANAATFSASNAVVSHIGHVTAHKASNGNRKIQLKVRILLGSWLIQNSAQNVGNRSRRTKVAIICSAGCASTISAGCVYNLGVIMVPAQVVIITVISSKR
jgi:hypothetical protein